MEPTHTDGIGAGSDGVGTATLEIRPARRQARCARTRSCSTSAVCTSSHGCPSGARGAGRSTTSMASSAAPGSGSATCATSRQRGWEGHALNLRAHFWSETADFEELDLELRRRCASPGYDALAAPAGRRRPRHGRPARAAVAERRRSTASSCISPALPAPLRPAPPAHVVRLVPRGSGGSSSAGRARTSDPAPAPRPVASRTCCASSTCMGAECGSGPAPDAGRRAGRPRPLCRTCPAGHRRRARPACSRAETASGWPTGSAPSTSPSGRIPTTGWSSASEPRPGRRLHPRVPGAPSPVAAARRLALAPVLSSPAPPHSSRGPGHRPLKAEITGSNPVCGTTGFHHAPGPRPGGVFYCPLPTLPEPFAGAVWTMSWTSWWTILLARPGAPAYDPRVLRSGLRGASEGWRQQGSGPVPAGHGRRRGTATCGGVAVRTVVGGRARMPGRGVPPACPGEGGEGVERETGPRATRFDGEDSAAGAEDPPAGGSDATESRWRRPRGGGGVRALLLSPARRRVA